MPPAASYAATNATGPANSYTSTSKARQRPRRRRTQSPRAPGGPQDPLRRYYSYLHNAVDDHSRLTYSEILANEKKETAVAFWQRAHAFFTQAGITVERVLTDSGSCYKSHLWRNSLTAQGISHKRTHPYRPQTNGKVERSNRTLLDEWAYARPYRTEADRRAAHPAWLHTYQSPPRTHRAQGSTTRHPRPQPQGSVHQAS